MRPNRPMKLKQHLIALCIVSGQAQFTNRDIFTVVEEQSDQGTISMVTGLDTKS